MVKNIIIFMAALLGAQFALAQTASFNVYDSPNDRRDSLKLRSQKTYEMRLRPDGALRVVIPVADIPLDAYVVDVVADFARAKKGDDGYWVLPDGRLGKFTQDNGAVDAAYRLKTKPIYKYIGPRPIMPVFGMKTPANCFIGVVKGLNLEMCPAVYANDGVYTVFPRFFIKHMDTQKPYEDIVVDYYFLKGADADYSGMARKYRQLRLDAGEVKPLKERAKDNPQLQYTASSIFVRVKHGAKATNQEKNKMVEDQTPENEPKINVYITFDRFMEIMRQMKALGIDNAEVCSVGGTAGGFDGRFPDVLPIPEEFGGEAKFRQSIKFGQSLGYQMVCHFATTAMFKVSKEWNPDFICKKSDGSFLTSGLVAGGRTHRLCPKVYIDHFLKRDWQTFRDFGFKGTHHIDVISCIVPYQCFDKKHPLNRKESAKYMNEIARYSREVFGGFGSEGPFDWVAPNLDFALYTTFYPRASEDEDPMVSSYVPFWQLVYHGIIISNPFYCTIDPTFGRKVDKYSDNRSFYSVFKTPEARLLKVIEYGGRPTFYYVNYKDLAPVKKAYDIYEKIKYLQYEYMDFHAELAPNVRLARYSNGDEIVCNYSDKPYEYKGRSVGAMSHELFKTH